MQINPRIQMHLLLWAYSICRMKRQHQVVQLRIMCKEYTQVTLEQRGKKRWWYRPTTLYWTQHRALTFLRLNKHRPKHLEPIKDLHWQYLSSQLVLHLWVKPIRQVPVFHGPLISLVIQVFQTTFKCLLILRKMLVVLVHCPLLLTSLSFRTMNGLVEWKMGQG